MPKTGYVPGAGNVVEKLFRGRTQVLAATAFYEYRKGGRVQKLVHALKYHGREEVADFAGRKMAEEWSKYLSFMPDVVVAVPMHSFRERQRGYNQAALIAQVFAEQLQVPFDRHSLIRVSTGASQTSKTRFDRYASLDGRFAVIHPENLEGKKVLLIDDVITTGATTIACLESMRQLTGVSLMVSAFAITRR
ncbi:MAG: ComF family protein [Bacteroidota bacterium]